MATKLSSRELGVWCSKSMHLDGICLEQEEDLIEISFLELSNIPQVKALIEALESLQFNIWNGEKSSCPNCGFIAPNHDNNCKIRIALAPFKKSAGDK